MAEHLTAGPELDRAVAEQVMGQVPCDAWEPINFGSAGGPAVLKRCAHPEGTCWSTLVYGGGGVPRYSTEIRESWRIVEHYRALGWLVRVQEHPDGFPFYLALDEHNMPDNRSRVDKRAMCLINLMGPANEGKPYRACEGRGYGASAPEAICRAALDLVENQPRATEV